MSFLFKVTRQKVLHLFLPLFVEKSYFTFNLAFDLGFCPLFPPTSFSKSYTYFFQVMHYYYVVILSLVLARETKIMYNIFLFNFTFKWNYHVQSCTLLKYMYMYIIFIFNFTFKCNFKCNYHVYKLYPGCRT